MKGSGSCVTAAVRDSSIMQKALTSDKTKRRLWAPMVNNSLVVERKARGISCNRCACALTIRGIVETRPRITWSRPRALVQRESYCSQSRWIRTVIRTRKLHFWQNRNFTTNVRNDITNPSIRESRNVQDSQLQLYTITNVHNSLKGKLSNRII